MEYQGVCIKKHFYNSKDGALKEAHGYWMCTADTVEQQMECSRYAPCSEAERSEVCYTAPAFSCRHCECGCSDKCSVAGGVAQ